MTDYNKIMKRVGIKKWVEKKGVKEVWIWGYHGGEGRAVGIEHVRPIRRYQQQRP